MSGAEHGAGEPDEATRILQAGNVPALTGDVQAMQVARPVEAAEERTTILVHAPLVSRAPSLLGTMHDDDERTTILHATQDLPGGFAGYGEADGGELAESELETGTATDGKTEDEAVEPREAESRASVAGHGFAPPEGLVESVLQPAAAGQCAGDKPDDAPTDLTSLAGQSDGSPVSELPAYGRTMAPAWAREAYAASSERVLETAALHSGDLQSGEDTDENTNILTAAAAMQDERTTILQQDGPATGLPATDAGLRDSPQALWAQEPDWAHEASLVHAGDVTPGQPEPFQTQDAGQTHGAWHTPTTQPPEAGGNRTLLPEQPAREEATSILPVAEPPPGPADSTEILPAAGLAGLPDSAAGEDGQVSGRAWFDRRLRDFNHALLHTQTGRKRPAAERQALAAAARDMIQRVGLRDPEHKATDWADTVLQADQLLVNTYFVRALIARGGVGEIYRARHRDLKTEHAIKILLPRYALDPTVLNLMLEEARLLQRVRHEAVVGCQGLLRDTDGRPMLVMDYLRGRTLSARLREGPLPQVDLMRLATRLASGLSALHAQGVVHQDISPDNIILVDDNCAAATIVDFGLARSLDAPENTHRNIDFAGKFSWCSPEQLSSRATHVDARSDLYSLGLVLAAAARGTRLDMGHDLASARAARHSVPSLGGIEEPVATLLRHLLAPSTAMRLRSAEEVPDWLRSKRPGFVQRLFGK